MRNGQAYQQKTEKFSVSEEKKFGKIDSRRRDFSTSQIEFARPSIIMLWPDLDRCFAILKVILSIQRNESFREEYDLSNLRKSLSGPFK